MSKVVEKLKKILHLERNQGYRDKAVIGGLTRFADTWLDESQASAEVRDSQWANEIAEQLRTYSRLGDRQSRQNLLKTMLESIARKESASSSPKAEPPRPQPQRQASRPVPSRSPEAGSRTGLDSAVTALSGVGDKQARRLGRLGVKTIRDALYLFPRRYDDFSTLKTINQLEYGEEVTIMGRVRQAKARRTRGKQVIVKAIIEDGSGTIEATWFNQPYLTKKLKSGRQIVLSGRVEEYLGRLTFQSPQWEPLSQDLLHTARLVPVYPLTSGLTARWLRKLIKRTVDQWAGRLLEHLPESVRQGANLVSLKSAIRQIHFPQDQDSLDRARYRLAFDEMFLIQIGVLRQRHRWRSEPGQPIEVDEQRLQRFVLSLPFKLTGAQHQALDEILSDLHQSRPMSRLLQGDVGSGKTVVAAAAMDLTAVSGAQAALMAPTEILAEQHYRNVTNLLQDDQGADRSNIALLTGSTPASDKEEIYRGLAQGEIDIVVGTHALIQEGVAFEKLALAVVDEQHRFGVAQRAALRQKGYNPHVLVMTATPIPRSLALTVYGDLDLSIIDEMPPGRQPVDTHVLLPTERERAYGFVRAQVEEGRQAFIICPLVEESAQIEARAAVEEYERLSRHVFPDLRLGLLHGRLKGQDKEATMAQFSRGELDILVSTSVVEVGIDVPNASVMLVEGANRFGLAQLHQFRGRVGRGEHASYCLLIADSTTPASRERLQAIEASNDGFALAEKDLDMRGPGEFFGTRQSGLPDLKLADVTDVRLLQVARAEAQQLFESDPDLASPDLAPLVEQVDRFWSGEGDLS